VKWLPADEILLDKIAEYLRWKGLLSSDKLQSLPDKFNKNTILDIWDGVFLFGWKRYTFDVVRVARRAFTHYRTIDIDMKKDLVKILEGKK
jgi:hypothetical protein